MHMDVTFSASRQSFAPAFSAEGDRVEVGIGSKIEVTAGGTTDHRYLTGRDQPEQHPISAIAGLEELLEQIQDRNYIFVQARAAQMWDIVHPLGKLPAVVVSDSAGNVVVGDIAYIDDGHIQIGFSGAFSGKAVLN